MLSLKTILTVKVSQAKKVHLALHLVTSTTIKGKSMFLPLLLST